jgi:LysM repeat protein
MLGYPFVTHAGFLSSILANLKSSTAQTTSASASAANSQSVRLLQSAMNLDPNPSKGGGDIMVVDGQALLPETGPSGTIADISDYPPASEISVYVVREGDTLSGIAAMFEVSTNTIVWANDLGKGGIKPGQSLVILPITGVKHTVKKGDTLASVAKKYKADADEIADYNSLGRSASLTEGDVIIIPDGTVAAAPVAKKPSTSTKNPYRGGSGSDLGGFFIWPVAGGVKSQGIHGYNGIDIAAPQGTPIYAAAGGTVLVARASGWNGGYGNYVVIVHSNGVQTLYAHMSSVAAVAGSSVGQGQVIGYVGSTGKSTGKHLHFEVRGAKNPF